MEDIKLTLTLNNNGSITANWLVLPGMVKQKVELWEVGKSYGIEVNDNWQGNSYTTRANLPANKQYNFKVTETGNGVTLGGDTQKILIRYDFYDNQPMGNVQNIQITPATTQIAIRFDAVPRAQSYDILFDNKVYNVTQTSKTFTSLTPKTSHTIAIRAKGSKMTGAYSATQTVMTLPVSPAVPAGIKKTATETTATISWNKVSGAISYDILFEGSIYTTTAVSRTFTGLTAGRSYPFQVRARNADVEGKYTSQIVVATPPKPPASVKAESTTDSITVTWNKVTEASGYLIRFNGSDTIMASSSSSKKFTSLKPETSYSYQVASRSRDGDGTFSAVKTISTLAKMPDVPSRIVGETTEDSVTIRWDAVSDATGYDIWFDGSTYSTSATSRTFTGLQDNTDYTYKVRSKNAKGVGEYGTEKKVKTTPKAPASSGVQASSDESSVTVSWEPVTGATSYDLMVDGKVYRVSGTSRKVTGLTPNTNHTYQIRVNNGNGSSSYSSARTLKTTPKPPTAVTESASRTDITLSWDSIDGATSYDVLFSGTTYRVTGTTKKMNGLTANTSYRYQIRVNNEDGSSTYSPAKTVKTLPFAPTTYPIIKSAVAAAEYVTLTWDTVSGATEYELRFGDKTYIVKGTSYRVTGLLDDTYYSYSIRSCNAGGHSDYSPYKGVRTLLKAPAVPTGLTAVAYVRSVTVGWSAVRNAKSYELIFDGKHYGTMATYYNIKDLKPNTVYQYQVRAKNDAGISSYSSSSTVRTLVAPPVSPTNVRATATKNSVTISWDRVSDATNYRLLFNGETYYLTDTSKTITGLTPDTEYEYAVCATNSGGTSDYTVKEIIRTIALGPPIPSDVTVEAGFNSVIVSFSPVPGAVDYDINLDGVICHVSGTSDMVSGRFYKVFPGLLPNTEHTCSVRANNAEGSSHFSTPETIGTAISKESGMAERSDDSTYADGKMSYTGCDPVNVLTGAFLWSYTCLEAFGKDKLHFTLMYDSDRDGFGKTLGSKWSHGLNYLLQMDENYAYFSTPYGMVIPFRKEEDNTFRQAAGAGTVHIMEQREDESYAVTRMDGTEYVFGADFVLDRIVENGLVKYRFAKNQKGQITQITGRHGSSLTFTYTGEYITGAADELGNTVSLIYQDGQLRSLTNPAGKEMFFTYDEEGRLLTVSDFTKQVYLTNVYDVLGRVVRQNMAGRGESSVTYDRVNRRTVFTDEAGNATSYQYDADGRVTDVELAQTGIHNSYDEYGRLIQQTDALGNCTKMTYDDRGRMNCVTYPDDTQEQVYYNDRNLPVRVVNRDETESQYQYDEKNNLIKIQDERGNSSTYAYDQDDNLVSWTDKEGNEWNYAYDEAGHLRQAIDPENHIYQYVHDALGRLASYTSPGGKTTFCQYSKAGDLVKIEDADGEVLFCYDENGNPTEITDRRGNKQLLEYNEMGQLASVTDFQGNRYQYTYDVRGNLSREINPLGAQTGYIYDAGGNNTARTDGNGNVTAYAFDEAGRLTQVTDAAGGILQYVYDAMGRIGTVIDPLKRQTVYTYDAQGRVISKINALGHSVSYTYDQAGNLLTRTDEDGVIITYTYDAENRLLTQTSPDGTTHFTYDKLGRMTAVKTPDEAVRTAAYDEDGSLTELSDQENNKTTYVYDEAGHLLQTTASDGGKTIRQYDENGNCTKITDAEGNSRSYTFNANNQITAVTDALGQITTCEYDEAGQLAAVTDARGGRRILSYDHNGNLICETNPLGGIRTYTYDCLNRMTKMADEEGNVKSCEYDAAGNMISFTDANHNTWNYDYDALNRMTGVIDKNGDRLILEYTNTGKIAKVTDKEGAETAYQYDSMGRLLQMTDAAGHSLKFTYDKMGRVLTQTDAAGNLTEYTYSMSGNLLTRKDPEGNTVSYTYDAAGRITRVTDALGNTMTYTRDALGQVTTITNAVGETMTFTYTANGQIETVTDASGNITAYTYDACGNLTQITDPLGHITSYEYDAMNHQIREYMAQGEEKTCETIYHYDKAGRMVRMINPMKEERSYTYDGNGNLAEITDEDGYVTTVTYDLNDQPLQMTYSDGRQATFRYNRRGELVEMKDWNGTMTMERDVLGRVSGITDHNGYVTGYTYDAAGNRTSIRYPDESVVNYTYDKNHRLTAVTDAQGNGTQYGYDAVGNLLTMIQPGNQASYTYNANKMPITAKYRTDDGAVMNVGLTYDSMGRITGFNRQSTGAAPSGNIAYTYDPLGRLLSCTEGQKQNCYSYDALGNRTAWKINDIEKATYSYDAMNRMTDMMQDGTAYGFTYDHRGNLTEEKRADSLIRQYVYDAANRMITGKDLLNGAQSDYTYNALHMRIGNTVAYPGAETPVIREITYIPDILSTANNDLMAYHNGTGVTRAVYGRDYERLGYTTTAGQVYEMPDLWGSPLYSADSQGNAAWRTGYDIWGNAETAAAPEADTAARFTSYTYDPVIGKYFAKERFYDSAQGRMLSPDPVKRGLNPYPYCDNDPVNYNDPTGEIPSILAGGLLGGFFGGASGFLGSTISQVMSGEKFSWRKALGSTANGAVVGAAKGALIGSGAGIPAAFAADFAAGASGNALEQWITKGRVDARESLLSGAGNALSELLYGTGEIKGLGDAFIRGARTGAVMSGIENLAGTAGLYGWESERNPRGGGHSRISGRPGRDPKGMCGCEDPFDLGTGLGRSGRGYHGEAGRGRTDNGGFSLGGFVKDVLTGAAVGGLGSAGFYGAGKAVEALKGSFVGRREVSGNRFPDDPNDLFPENYVGLKKEVKLDGKINYTVQAGDKTYRIEYHPKHVGDGHYEGNHYHVLKLGEMPKPGKSKPPYFRIPNLDPCTSAQGGTFAPGDLLPTKNRK